MSTTRNRPKYFPAIMLLWFHIVLLEFIVIAGLVEADRLSRETSLGMKAEILVKAVVKMGD